MAESPFRVNGPEKRNRVTCIRQVFMIKAGRCGKIVYRRTMAKTRIMVSGLSGQLVGMDIKGLFPSQFPSEARVGVLVTLDPVNTWG